MKIRGHMSVQTSKCSIHLSFTEKTINLFLGNKFDPQNNARLQKPFLDQSENGHVTYPKFFSRFSHSESVPLHPGGLFDVFCHGVHNEIQRECRMN